MRRRAMDLISILVDALLHGWASGEWLKVLLGVLVVLAMVLFFVWLIASI
jgi:hypothetical protein